MTRALTGRAGLAGAATLITALFALVWAQSAGAGVPRTFYGVAPQTPLGASDFQRMGAGNVGLVRVFFNWSQVDPGPAPDDYDWSLIDPIMNDAAWTGVQVLPFLYGTPRWVARDLDNRRCGFKKCPLFAPKRKAALAAWQAFVAEAAFRYGPGGEFWTENPSTPPNPITAWQIWNEQNSRSFFRPKPRPRQYANMLAWAASGIRQHDPNAKLILGGMPELPGVKKPKAIKGSSYLRRLYRVKGVKRNFDGVAPHPYGARMKKVRKQVNLIRRVSRKARDRRVEMWITEIGWGSAKRGNPLNRGAKGQAKRLRQAYRFFKRKRGRYNVKTLVWFSWMDSASEICAWCPTSGLLRTDGASKPSWRAFTKLTGGTP